MYCMRFWGTYTIHYNVTNGLSQYEALNALMSPLIPNLDNLYTIGLSTYEALNVPVLLTSISFINDNLVTTQRV